MVSIDIDFILCCVQSSNSIVLKDISGGSTVLKVPEYDIAIKYGGGVAKEEADAQARAFALLDPAVVRVPKPHLFHRDTSTGTGYLAMEWIDGSPLDLQDETQVNALRKMIDYLQSFHSAFPGPLHQGEPQGLLWEDSAPDDHHSVEGLHDWIHKWQHTPVDFSEEDFVLCHLDTAIENILWLRGGQICLLDWSSAGYYPRYFELAAHLKKGAPDEVILRLLQSPQRPFSTSEKGHMDCLIEACANTMRYAKPRPAILPKQPERRYLAKQKSLPQLS